MCIRAATRTFVLLMAGGLTCAPLMAQQPAHPHHTMHPKKLEKEQVEALETQWQQAMLNDDVAAMDKLLSDDYLGVTAAGDLVTKNQQLDRMRNRQVTVTKLETTEVKFKLIGQIAIVTSLAQVEAVSDGRAVTGEYRYTRVYQRLPNGVWKITSFEATRVPPGYKPDKHMGNDAGKS